MLKKILLASIFVITAITNITHAEDDMKTVASKAYVDTKIETKQLKIPAAGQPNVGAGETVMTYTATGNGQIGERGLYSDISSYNATTDGDKLITASALNATFTNLPTTPTTKLECANQADGCTLWTIVDQTAYGDMLPSGYTRLEYIQSTGTQYINTELTGAAAWYITAQSESFTTTGNKVLVARYNSGATFFGAIKNTGKWGAGDSTASSVVPYTTKADMVINFASDSIFGTVNGENFSRTSSATAFSNSYQLLGFGNNYLFIGKLFSARALQNNVIVRDLVPAKNSSGVVGMYDTVSGQFFTNAATSGDDFTPGPPAN